MTLASGSRLGHYEIVSAIGAGGMGEVYRATDTNLGRQVAIKVLPEAFAQDPERVARFEREAKTLASLNHPNIAIIHGLETSQGTYALVMELVEGEDLSERISRGPIPIDEAFPIAKQVAEALEAAHEQGIIHRDLKPANIKVREDGTVKVLDFGLAKLAERSPTSPSGPIALSMSPTITSPVMTGIGVLLGTAAYMAPEQAKGRPADKRSDIWAFGCVLYEMLTGTRAFDGEDVTDTLAAVLKSEPKWDALPDTLSASLRVFLRRCLHKDPKQRVGDIRDVRLALEGAFEIPESDRPRSLTFVRPLWRRAINAGSALIIGGLAVGLVSWTVWPRVASQPVYRFNYGLRPNQAIRGAGYPVVALSRDGRHVVYNTNDGLYLRRMDESDARLIPGTVAFSIGPFFAPDGESIAFFDGASLKRISISGGAAVTICPASLGFGASWNADNTILFAQSKGIMRVSANGGTPELVIASKDGEQFYGPQLLPDGDSVLFSAATVADRARWDTARIVVHSLSTGARKVVLQGGSDARYVPTGHLVYAFGDELFAVAFDATQLEVTGKPVLVVQGVARGGNPAANTAAANYGISDNGTLVYVDPHSSPGFQNAPQFQTGIPVWVDRQGREEVIEAPPRAYQYPRISPDGTRIAMTVNGEEQDIWIWDIRRRTFTRFTFDSALDTLPVWTPDGQRILWASQRSGPLNLYWQAADGTGTAERLTNSASAQRPSGFTPDGSQLLLMEGAAGAQPQDLGILTPTGERRVTWLVQTRFSELGGVVSPDNRWLAYESDESGVFQIYVRPFPAVNEGRWQVSPTGGREPLWAPSGRELFYVAPDGALMSVPVDVPQARASFTAGVPATLIAGNAGYLGRRFNQLGRTYDVSPDGRRFLRIKLEEEPSGGSASTAAIIVVLNWFEELKRLVPTT